MWFFVSFHNLWIAINFDLVSHNLQYLIGGLWARLWILMSWSSLYLDDKTCSFPDHRTSHSLTKGLAVLSSLERILLLITGIHPSLLFNLVILFLSFLLGDVMYVMSRGFQQSVFTFHESYRRCWDFTTENKNLK